MLFDTPVSGGELISRFLGGETHRISFISRGRSVENRARTIPCSEEQAPIGHLSPNLQLMVPAATLKNETSSRRLSELRTRHPRDMHDPSRMGFGNRLTGDGCGCGCGLCSPSLYSSSSIYLYCPFLPLYAQSNRGMVG